MIKIAHFSDNHGDLSVLASVRASNPDVIISSGDFFPNSSRGIPEREEHFQTAWFRRNSAKIIHSLHGVPVLCVSGNHDYVSLAKLLCSIGVDAREITVNGLEFMGKRFAGFREIPYIAGEWCGEATQTELAIIVQELFENPPDILVTHSPPGGILDLAYGETHIGIECLTGQLCYGQHNIELCLYGHAHESPGFVEVCDIQFYNSACTIHFIEI